MKYYIKTILVFLVLPIFCSCGRTDGIEISGVINNLAGAQFKINDTVLDPDADGAFVYRDEVTESGYYTLDFGKPVYLYLKPGNRLTVSIDASAPLSSVTVSGDQLEINRFLVRQSHQSWLVNESFNRNFNSNVALPEEDFVSRINAIWQPFRDNLDTFISEKSIGDNYFIKTQRASMLYSRADILLRYPDWHRQIGGDSGYIPAETYYDFVKKLDLNDEALVGEEEYDTFVNRYFEFKTDELLKTSTEFDGRNYKRFRAQLKTALQLFTNQAVRDEKLYLVMSKLLPDYQHKGIGDILQTFNSNCSSEEYKREIDGLLRSDLEIRQACIVQEYKHINGVSLDVHIYKPPGLKVGDRRPALAFFHGGGWECGKPEWGKMQCDHFSAKGLVAFSFEYRLSTQHDSTPIEGLKDTKSAIRWIRQNAEEFGVDPGKIVGSGYSAGGQLVMCTTMVEGYDEESDDLSVNPAVNAMLLWVTPAVVYPGWFTSLLRGRAELRKFNPIDLITSDLPPAIFFQGTADDTVPYKSVVAYVEKAREAGNRCDLEVYPEQTHLNWGDNGRDVLKKMDQFLKSTGYFPGGNE